MSKYTHDLSAMTWFVEVLCSGGWKVIGGFADEGAAWEFGGRHIDARVYNGEELIGVKDGYQRPWRAPTEHELSRDTYIVENVRTGERYHAEILQHAGPMKGDLFISSLEGAKATAKALNAESGSNNWEPKVWLYPKKADEGKK